MPLVAMPVSLVGAAVVMYAFGFSLNLLTISKVTLYYKNGQATAVVE